MPRFLILAVALSVFASCTDATKANLSSYGQEHHIRMFNGGVLVAEWFSTGKVSSMRNSDGWEFMDKKTRTLVRVGGDVIIEVVE